MAHQASSNNNTLSFPDDLETMMNTQSISDAFFEFANAKSIVYDKVLTFEQDVGACNVHTGGIVWETAYILLEYLKQQRQPQTKLGRCIELGAGVGFLGQCVAYEKLCTCMLLTETRLVYSHLCHNVRTNNHLLDNVSCCPLDWTRYQVDTEQNKKEFLPHLFDTILSTDVLFAPHLVEPLLKTAQAVAHAGTVWYLCIQIRCPTTHHRFLELAPRYGFVLEQLDLTTTNAWATVLECLLFRITRAQ